MPRLIWVFAGCTATLLVLSCRGSCTGKFSMHFHNNFFIYSVDETRAVRGSDYSPTTLSEEKDKLVHENWRDREKKKISKDYTKTTCTISFRSENICKVSNQLKENCKWSCDHKIPTVHTLWLHFMSKKETKLKQKKWEKIIKVLYQNHMYIFISYRKHLQCFKTIRGKL